MPAAASRRIVTFVNIAHGFDHMLMLIFPTAVLAMEGAFGLPYGELLALSLGGFVAFGAFSIPAGWLGDRWSRHRMMILFFFGIGLSALATGFASQPWHLAVGLFCIGMFAAIYHPVGGALLIANVQKMGRDLGINGVWGNMGVALAALITGALSDWFGWRAAFMLPGAAALIAGIFYLLLVPDMHQAAKAAAKKPLAIPRGVVIRAFAVLSLVTIAGGLTFNAGTVSLPKLFEQRLDLGGLSTFGVGAVAALVFSFGAVAQLIIGNIIDRYPLRRVFIPVAALQAPCFFLAGWAVGWPLAGLAAGIMFAMFGQVTINDAMIARYTTDEWRARAFALRYVMSFGASATAVPLIAWLHGRSGDFQSLYMVLAACGVVIFAGALAFPLRPEEVEPAAVNQAAE
ncbi:MFS transporter [Ferrovibrio sp.]|uniref:MFS transporter n=1 Tax=Ferrovibrio sp. TaxID=1917215 RepID=UPI0025C4AC8C|nr:MFS transporter [Ferrovibrio sp.]MBX3453958.1 MFS transporter [Ferrovibrio sp.]